MSGATTPPAGEAHVGGLVGEADGAAAVRRLEGDEVVAWIRARTLRGYRYEARSGFSWTLIAIGGAAAVAAFVLASQSGLALWVHRGGFAVLLLVALYTWLLVARWSFFVVRSYVALADDALLVGRGSRAWVVPNERLTRDAIALEGILRGGVTSQLPLVFPEAELRVHLVGPLAQLKNVQRFIADVLAVIAANEAAAADLAENESPGSAAAEGSA